MVDEDMFRLRSVVQRLEHTLDHHKHSSPAQASDTPQWQLLDDLIKQAELTSHTTERRANEVFDVVRRSERHQQEAYNQYHALRSQLDLIQSKVLHLFTSDPTIAKGLFSALTYRCSLEPLTCVLLKVRQSSVVLMSARKCCRTSSEKWTCH